MPRYFIAGIALVVVLAILPFVIITKTRAVRSSMSRIHLIQDMDNQPKFKEQSYNPLFADHRAMRPRIPGTVRQEIDLDQELLLTGRENGEFSNNFPFEITDSVLERGRERFNIFCSTCHGMVGYGDGMTAVRAEQLQEGTWTPPLSYHTDQVRQRPNGHIFNTITFGIRNMAPYGSQIPPSDRWAIIAYIRALQLSQAAPMENVPEETRLEFR